MTDAEIHLHKALECPEGAESEFVNKRFGNCVNRAYFASFHAAVAALLLAGKEPPKDGKWSHSGVQADFSGLLIRRMKRYPSELRDSLSRNMDLRHVADYRPVHVPEIAAARAYRRAQVFVAEVWSESGKHP